jgi:putative 4-mercaptohistidine N1-methyltranferase
VKANYYQTDRAVSEYLLFHYGEADQIQPWPFGPSDALRYPERCVGECLDPTRLPAQARALDLGCAVGRATFELARHCREAIGIDFSEQFVAVAAHLQRQGTFPYAYSEEGEILVPSVASVPPDLDRSRVAFEPGDAQRLRPDLGRFDVILMANLIDRLSDPRACLSSLAGLMNPGGQLIITSPYTWLEEYTPKDRWLGGTTRDGKTIRTIDSLREILENDFDLVRTRDLPFLIREHARKFQWSVAQATMWRRRAGNVE